jgi:hypothetical protein
VDDGDVAAKMVSANDGSEAMAARKAAAWVPLVGP